MIRAFMCAAIVALVSLRGTATAEPAGGEASPRYDPDLARTTGADQWGMKGYVLIILKTGPTPLPAGPERDAMFKGSTQPKTFIDNIPVPPSFKRSYWPPLAPSSEYK